MCGLADGDFVHHVLTCMYMYMYMQVLMKFMEMLGPDSGYLASLTKKLSPPLGEVE